MKLYNPESLSEIQIPYSRLEKFLEIASVTGVFINFIILIYSSLELPFTNDHYLSPFLAIMTVCSYTVMTMLNQCPHLFNYPWPITEDNVNAQYKNERIMSNCLKVEIIWFLVYEHWKTVQVGLGKTQALGYIYMPIFLMIILGTLAFFFYKGWKLR